MSTSLDSAVPAHSADLTRVVNQLLASYQELQRYLIGQLRNRDDAIDVAQSSFAQAYAYALSRPVDNARALLFQSARNLCVDQFRRQKVEQLALETWGLHCADWAPSTESVVAARQELQLLMRRIERMPVLRREVFVRIRVYGQTHREVMAELQLKAKAVEQHIARAVFDLSELLLTCAPAAAAPRVALAHAV
jgi:DNA-directed RNA polymerase specialized sigma24 family protein